VHGYIYVNTIIYMDKYICTYAYALTCCACIGSGIVMEIDLQFTDEIRCEYVYICKCKNTHTYMYTCTYVYTYLCIYIYM